MNNQFKVSLKSDEKNIFYSGKLSSLDSYKTFKKNIVNYSIKNLSKNGMALIEKDNFVLEIKGQITEKITSITHIFDSKTFEYFLEQLNLDPDNEKITLKFVLEKVEKLPRWEIPHYDEALESSLNESFKEIKENLKYELAEEKLKEGKKVFEKQKFKIDKDYKDSLFRGTNIHIVCENCFSSNFFGPRYACSECNNFNLCQECYDYMLTNLSHDSEHTWIEIKTPIFEDINKFNNIINPHKLFKEDMKTSFKIEFTIVNNGENDLQGCFIAPIRYGKKYLGCLKRTITDNVEKGKMTKISTIIKFPDDKSYGEFQGYFRMFTENGIPFGDILNIKVNRKDN